MIDDVVEMVGFDEGNWDEVLVISRYEVEKHIDNGYNLVRYFESYDPREKERIYAELEKNGEKIIIFASPSDGLCVSRIPVAVKAVALVR